MVQIFFDKHLSRNDVFVDIEYTSFAADTDPNTGNAGWGDR